MQHTVWAGVCLNAAVLPTYILARALMGAAVCVSVDIIGSVGFRGYDL